MALVYDIDPQLGLICKRGEGIVTENELLEQLDAETRHPHFRRGLRKIVDFHALKPRIDTQGIRRLVRAVRRLEESHGAARWAIVTDDDLVYGLVRMFMAYGSDLGISIEVFRRTDEAQAWLRLPADFVCPLTPHRATPGDTETRVQSATLSGTDTRAGHDPRGQGSGVAPDSQLAHPPLQRGALQPEDRRGTGVAA